MVVVVVVVKTISDGITISLEFLSKKINKLLELPINDIFKK